MKKIQKKIQLLPIISVLSLMPAANAATIMWEPAVTFGTTISTADIITGVTTTITDHDRFNAPSGGTAFGGVATGSDITGIVFNDGSIGSGNTSFSSAELTAALKGFDSGNNAANTTPLYQADTITFTGLTEGLTYQVQLFYSDQRSADDARLITWDDGNGNTVILTNTGSYAIGTFVADNTLQQAITGGGVGLGGDLNLSVIAQVPEPSTTGFLVGAMGLLVLRRRRA